MHVRNGGHAVDTEFGESRLRSIEVDVPMPTRPFDEIESWPLVLLVRLLLIAFALFVLFFIAGFLSRIFF